jgi:hypothetical protein
MEHQPACAKAGKRGFLDMLPVKAFFLDGYFLRVTILVPVVSRFPVQTRCTGLATRDELNAITLRTESYGD